MKPTVPVQGGGSIRVYLRNGKAGHPVHGRNSPVQGNCPITVQCKFDGTNVSAL